ncbi:MAG: shikimate dehydrogenase [Gammaproteobacteria bacterium]|nr:shikimate dehydrogenase [Gammaproteobacteria bacterium]MDP2139690.1 shikimate dehydrogenase [Gammaproteobacteria bacterium]MDP2348894.1 shikimate dehydrogenase [Gammaproteobacteria bacterium]
MDRYAVFGNPVKHSRSPWIHARFAQQTGQSLVYSADEIPLDEFEKRVLDFFAKGGAGLNITVPFKERAWALCDTHGGFAAKAGAVNTLFRNKDGQLCGDNTDGIGLLRDITDNHRGQIAGKSVLLVGAGGAVRGVLPSFLAENPAKVTIVNRTVIKAQELAALLVGQAEISAIGFEELEGRVFDLIVNGTSAGLHGDLPPMPSSIVSTDTWCYDMIYGRGDTVFQAWARQCGAAKALDGVGMLVEQAAQAFYLWRGIKPETAAVIADLRAELSASDQD